MQTRLRSHRRRHALRWHLGGLLLVKAVLLYVIWFVWFSAPVPVGPRQITEALLTPSRTIVCNDPDPSSGPYAHHCNAARP